MLTADPFAYVADLLQAADVAFCLFDAEDRTVWWNARFLEFFPEHDGPIHAGEPYRNNLQRFYENRLAGDERAQIDRYVDEGIARHRTQTRPFVFEHRGRRLRVTSLPAPDGRRARIWLELPYLHAETGRQIPAADGLENIPDGAVILDEHDRIVAANREFRRLYDIAPSRPIVGATLAALVQDLWDAAGEPTRVVAILDHMRFAGMPFEIELPGDRWRRVIAQRLATGFGYFTHSDITMLKRQQRDLQRAHDELATIAHRDALTGVANRRQFDSALQDASTLARRSEGPLSLMLLDLDRFKLVNDRFGHAIGDACLQRAARVIERASRRPSDLVARFGGEEFALILPGAPLTAAQSVGARITKMMATEPWTQVHPGLGPVSFSMGLSDLQADPDDAEAMVARADAALYRAKRNGRNRLETAVDLD